MSSLPSIAAVSGGFLFPPSSQVVDDNLVNRMVAARFFSRFGSHVDTVESGERALEALTRCNGARAYAAESGSTPADVSFRSSGIVATRADTLESRQARETEVLEAIAWPFPPAVSSTESERRLFRTPFASYTEGAAASGAAADSWTKAAEAIVMAEPDGDSADFDGQGGGLHSAGMESDGMKTVIPEPYDFVFMDLQMPDMDG